MLPTHEVDCPQCGKFAFTALSLEDLVPADAPNAPRVLHDKDGDYVPCPSCGARIAMKRVQTRGGAGFRVTGAA